MPTPTSATSSQQDNASSPFDDILLQINFADPKEKQDIETGLKIAKRIYATQTTNSGSLNFFQGRSARWITLEKWAKGIQDMTEFLDFFNVSDGNKAYVKIDMTPIMVGAQFVGTLVDSMCKTEEYPCVKAVDEDSMDEKEQRKLDALFRMHEGATIDDLQQQAGVQLEPTNAYVPDDELSAQVYFELEDQLPKEIKFEKRLEKTLMENQYERVLKRRFVYDLVVKNFEASKIEIDIHGKKNIRKCIPQNCIYNYFVGDTGRLELKYFGEIYNLKVSDARIKYGQSPSRPNGLTEKQLYDLARFSTTNNTGLGFNFPWMDQYTVYNNRRPWDDYAIYIFDFEIALCDTEYYTNSKDSYGKDNITPKRGIPQPQSPNTSVLKREKVRWYNGVYAPFAQTMLYWGLPDFVIFPYTNVQHGMSSYTVNIPFNNGDYVPSLFERGMETLKEYALTKLKRKQLIAKLRPSGIRIDVESARNLDLGNGNTIAWEEVVRIFDQTGNELWSSKGINPNEREMPAISTTAQDDTINKIFQLTQVLASQINDLRQLWGVPLYRDGSDLPERASGRQAEQQNAASFNVTDFIENSHQQFIQETLYKLCLVEWQQVVKEEPESEDDLINTKFDVSVKMKMTEYQKEQLQQKIQVAMQTIDQNTGKPLLSFKDAFRLEQIDNFKLANMYLSNMIEENERRAEADKTKREQANIQSQQQSAQLAAQEQQKMQDAKLEADKQMREYEALQQMKVAIVNGSFVIAAKGAEAQPPQWLASIIQQLIPNITIPIQQENKQMAQQVIAEQAMEQQMQQAAMQQMQQQPQDMGQMQDQGQMQMQPQEQMAMQQ